MPVTRFLKDPLLHFLVLGTALFVGYRLANPPPDEDEEQIVVSSGQIEHLLTTFQRTWQRPPTEEETKGLIDQYIREEVLSREAIKLGLHQNDTIIRRRLQQKMEFLAEDSGASTEPTQAELESYLGQNLEAFREDQRFTFRHVLLNPEKHGERTEEEAARLLAALRAQGREADTSTLGDATLLPPELDDEPRRSVETSFGREFAHTLATLPVGVWQGPIRSGVGVHLVLVEKRSEGRVPALADVREAVKREWENARRAETSRAYFEALLRQYRVSIERPEPAQAATARQ